VWLFGGEGERRRGGSSPCGEGGRKAGNGGQQVAAVVPVLPCPKVEDESGGAGCWAIRLNGP
jgi:hypothetical protein